MIPEEMAYEARRAIANKTMMSMVRVRGVKMPLKFPRGELLCEHADGHNVYSYDPARILKWLETNNLVKAVRK
jgi:hypothetical protein